LRDSDSQEQPDREPEATADNGHLPQANDAQRMSFAVGFCVAALAIINVGIALLCLGWLLAVMAPFSGPGGITGPGDVAGRIVVWLSFCWAYPAALTCGYVLSRQGACSRSSVVRLLTILGAGLIGGIFAAVFSVSLGNQLADFWQQTSVLPAQYWRH
jgi:hypothetical protein